MLPPSYNGPLRRELLLASGHEDLSVIDDIQSGFKMHGILPDTRLFDNISQADIPTADSLGQALEHAPARREDTLRELLQESRRESDMAEVLKQTEAELTAGKLEGPWEVWADKHGVIHSTVPYAEWLPTRRFPRVQKRTAASYSVRPIDDATASGLNPATATTEKMRMAGLATLLDIVSYIAEEFWSWGDDGLPMITKGDHLRVYRQWPVHPDDASLLVCLLRDDSVGEGGGASARTPTEPSPLARSGQYSRVAACVVHPLRRIFSVPQSAYVDDFFFRASPGRWAALHEWVFQEVHSMLGVPLKLEKNQGPAAALDLLGLEVVSAPRWAGLRLTDKRLADLAEEVDTALRARRLSRWDAARVGGQTGFATTAMFGNIGRVYCSTREDGPHRWPRRCNGGRHSCNARCTTDASTETGAPPSLVGSTAPGTWTPAPGPSVA